MSIEIPSALSLLGRLIKAATGLLRSLVAVPLSWLPQARHTPIDFPSGGPAASPLQSDLDGLGEGLREALEAGKLTCFFTKKYVFSNHFPCQLKIEGLAFNCTEQYYMYMKAKTFNDSGSQWKIINAVDPKRMKFLGSSVSGFDEATWNSVSRDVMETANRAKYTQNEALRTELFRTSGTVLVETNPMDARWGIGLATDDMAALDVRSWRGQNWLGFILTQIREELMKDSEYRSHVRRVRKDTRLLRYPHLPGVLPE